MSSNISTLRMYIKAEKKFVPDCLRKPRRPKMDYKSIVEYIRKRQTVLINYNCIVIGIGLFGILLSLILFIVLFCLHKDKVFSHPEFFPAAIWSIMVTAFNGIELEARKKELHKFLISKLKNGTKEDAIELLQKIKDLSWDEYKIYYQ